MKLSLITITVLMTVLAAPLFSQESSREDFKEFCNAWQGRWVGEVTWVADWEAYGKKGEKVTAYCDLKVMEDGNVLLARFYGGKGSATGVAFFDAGEKRIKWLWVNSGGGVSHDTVYKDGEKWIVEGTGSEANGAETEHVSTVTISDNGNMHTWTGKGRVGDRKTDDRLDVWRRVSD